jgi:hypothetical protein
MKDNNSKKPDLLSTQLYTRASSEVNKKVAEDLKQPDPEPKIAKAILSQNEDEHDSDESGA